MFLSVVFFRTNWNLFSGIAAILAMLSTALGIMSSCQESGRNSYSKYLFGLFLVWGATALYATVNGHSIVAGLYFIPVIGIAAGLSYIKRRLAVIPAVITLVIALSLLGIVPKWDILLKSGFKLDKPVLESLHSVIGNQ